MKTVNRICQVLSIAFGLGALVMFFLNFAVLTVDGSSVSGVGAVFAFGSKLKIGDTAYDMAKSVHLLLCFWLTAIGFVMSIFSFKSKRLRYAAPAFGLAAAIYMLVLRLRSPWKVFDLRTTTTPQFAATELSYTGFVWICVIALFLFAVFAVAYLLIDDALEVAASKGEKLTIPKRVVRFFRDYKSEINKIVWPGLRDVVKNTVIVLIMCLLVGILIWLFDFGLGKLLELILTKK